MTQSEYKSELRDVLKAHSQSASKKIALLLENLPSEAKSLEFGVFPAQDGDGTFDVMASLTGPDLYVLNRKVQDYRSLFEVNYTPAGLKTGAPIFDVIDDPPDFDVNDAIVDTVAEWLSELWIKLGTSKLSIPASVYGDDGYGTETPKKLS